MATSLQLQQPQYPPSSSRSASRTCRFCFKTFSKAEHLSRHERSHTKERPFKCKDCGKCYSRKLVPVFTINITQCPYRSSDKVEITYFAFLPHCPHAYSLPFPSILAAGLWDLAKPSDNYFNKLLTGHSDTLLRHCKVHNKGNKVEQQKSSPSDYDTLSSPGRLDAAAATLVDLQILTERGNGLIEPGAPNNDVSNSFSAIDPSLQAQDRQNPQISHSNVNFLDHRMMDSEMQQPAQASQNGAYAFSTQPEFWSMEIESQYPSWHIGEDFDLHAFNNSLLAPMFVDESTWLVSPEGQGDVVQTARGGPQSPSANSIEMIQGLWITKADDNSRKKDAVSYSVAPTRPITPTTLSSAGNGVDERYRDDLSLRLRPRWKEDPLPSTEFLVCI